MDISSIKKKISRYKQERKSLFTTSSFQSHSIVLLHILSTIDQNIPVYFINTGYHFPETILFKEKITSLFGLNTIDTYASTPKYMQKDGDNKLLFTSDPDYCCYLNKTQPMEQLLIRHDVWINGIRADQSAIRKSMDTEEAAPHGVTRFHPMLDWDAKMVYAYQKKFDLPKHPLEEKGFVSIGCEPCTRKPDPEMLEREARWYGLKKSECGLHTDLVVK